MSNQRILISGLIIGAIRDLRLLNSILHITNNVNSTYFEVYSFVVRKLPAFSEDSDNVNISNKVTIIGRNWVVSSFSSIPNNLYGNDHEFRTLDSNAKIGTEKVLLVIDERMKNSWTIIPSKGKDSQTARLK